MRSWWSWKSLWKSDTASYLQEPSLLLYQYPFFLFIKSCVWMMHLLTFVLCQAKRVWCSSLTTSVHTCADYLYVCIKSSISFPLNGRKDQVWPWLRGDLCLTDVSIYWMENQGECLMDRFLVSSLCFLIQYLKISVHHFGFLQSIRWQSWLSPVYYYYYCCCYISIIIMSVWSFAWKMKLQLLVSSFISLLAYGCCDEVMTLLSEINSC